MAKKHSRQCEACIHARVCYLKTNRENYTGVLNLTPCEFYRTEADTSELPCAVGQLVYMLVYYQGGIPSHYRAKTCTGIHISCEKAVRNRTGTITKYLIVSSDIGRAEHIPFREIGKNVFFSEEEARKAIEEKLNARR